MIEKLKALMGMETKTIVEQLADAVAAKAAAEAKATAMEATLAERDAAQAKATEEHAKADELVKQTLAQAQTDLQAAQAEAAQAKAALAEKERAMSQCSAYADAQAGTSPVEPGGEAEQSSPAQIYAAMPKGNERLAFFRRNKAAILREQMGAKADK